MKERWEMNSGGGRAGNMHQVTSVIYVCSLAVHEDKGVDDPGEVTCFAGSNKGSNSEVQSLSSFQSDSGDDNGKKSWACSPRAGSASCQWLRGRWCDRFCFLTWSWAFARVHQLLCWLRCWMSMPKEHLVSCSCEQTHGSLSEADAVPLDLL